VFHALQAAYNVYSWKQEKLNKADLTVLKLILKKMKSLAGNLFFTPFIHEMAPRQARNLESYPMSWGLPT
jgi:hypothetical protein